MKIDGLCDARLVLPKAQRDHLTECNQRRSGQLLVHMQERQFHRAGVLQAVTQE